MSRFPVVFRLPAFASRVVAFPLGDWASLAVGLPAKDRTPSGFHVPHAQDTTGVGALSTPGMAVLTRPLRVLGRRLPRFLRHDPCTPALPAPIRGST